MKSNNTFLFLGTDNDSGVSTITQSIGEMLAELTSKKVLILTLNHKPNDEFIKETSKSIDNLRNRLTSKIITVDDVLRESVKVGHSKVLIGPRDIVEVRNYEKRDIEHLIQLMSNDHESIVLIDAGTDLDNPLTITSLMAVTNRFLVTTQNQQAFNEYKRKQKYVLSKLNIENQDFTLIINKCNEEIHLETQLLKEQYSMNIVTTVPFASEWWGAEAERRLLHHFNDEVGAKLQNVIRLIGQINDIQIEFEEQRKGSIINKLFSKVKGG